MRVGEKISAFGLAALFVLPWHAIDAGFFSEEWLPYYPMDQEVAPAWAEAVFFGRWWLWPIVLFLGLPFLARLVRRLGTPRKEGGLLVFSGVGGLAYLVLESSAIGPLGFTFESGQAIFGEGGPRQLGLGAGALAVALAFLFLWTTGAAKRGAFKGDAFVAGALGVVASGVVVFVALPVLLILEKAFEDQNGALSMAVFADKALSSKTWISAAHSLLLALAAGTGSTVLGLSFALFVARTRFAGRRLVRALTVLPIITPPFVVGLAIILVFGRAGALTVMLERLFGIPGTRYIFGWPGILLAQLLSLSPIAFLVLIGVVEGISPSLEEAAEMLRADRRRTFFTVTLPLLRPGLANAFLLCFIESLADFGNPLVLGGSFEVLPTEIYFAVAGAQNDVPRASALALVLLALTFAAFWVQKLWVEGRRYVTVTGKGDAGIRAELPGGVRRAVAAIALPWALFTVAIYLLILAGGFVRVVGRDHGLTLAHYADVFAVARAPDGGLRFSGGAWNSFGTTVLVALVSAPLTALFGLLTAYLLERHTFKGKGAFELMTMLSFAIPGTVVGVAYVLAFNAPPIELTGSAAILVVCFLFRNMPVGVRAGLAGLSQIDKSLDEASLTLGAGTFRTLLRVSLPLLRPQIVAGLVYGFVRAMTAVSAVIFLVSADHDLATTYILGRVENGAYGPAIAYASVLIVLMLAAIALIERAVGRTDVGRRELL